MLMNFLYNTLFTDVFWIGNGLVSNKDYNNSNAVVCSNWQNNVFHVPNCDRDLGMPDNKSVPESVAGWSSPLDVPTFLLHELMPSWLAFIQDSSNLPFPLNLLFGSALVQGWLHRWDTTNFTCPNPPPLPPGPDRDFSPACIDTTVAFSQQWTCAVFVELVPTIIYAYTLFILLLFNPFRIGQSILYTLCTTVFFSSRSSHFCSVWLIYAAGYLLLAFLFGVVGVFLALPARYLQANAERE